MTQTRRAALGLIAGALPGIAMAQSGAPWPNRPIRLVVPWPPGQATDLAGRVIAQRLQERLGQPVVPENRAGAGGTIGSDVVAKAAPDGYTFLAPAGGVITNAMIKTRMPYKEGDLLPVAMMAVSPSVIVVAADSPIRDLKGLVAASKKGEGLNFSTAGTGSTPHFVAEMLKLKSGAKLQIIPYKSGSEGMAAVIGKQVEATSEASVVVLPQIKGGKLRPIASTWSRRIAALPDLPTAQEQGFSNVLIGHWSGIFAPRGTPEDILDKMNRAVDAALKTSELRARLIPQGIDPIGGTRAEFVKFLDSEKARLGPIAKAAQMKED